MLFDEIWAHEIAYACHTTYLNMLAKPLNKFLI